MARFYGIFLIIALVAVSGVIAYVGDIVGRKMGRKRLSLFGMRPRHTAIAISVVAGMLITFLTLAVAMSVSKDVKDGFLRVSQMRQAQEMLAHRLAALDRELAQREQELEGVREAAEQERAGLTMELADTNGVLEATRAALGQEQGNLKRARQAGEQLQVELNETRQLLGETRSALGQEQEKLARAAAEVKKREEVLTRQVLVNTNLTKEQEKLLRDIDTLKAWKAWLTRDLVIQRGLPILFGAGQALTVDLIDGRGSIGAIRTRLDEFVARLDVMVRAAGARSLSGSERAVVLGKPVPDPGGDSLIWASPEQVLDAVAERIHESEGEVIVRAFSVMNTHKGESVPVDFELFHNHLVFRQGETLAETILDGRLSPPALMSALVSLLRDEVGAKARAANVMPRQGPGGSEAFGSPREAVGEMSFEELFLVIEEVQGINGPARVSAVAAADIWTIGPLEADILVEPIAPVPAS